jgi:hypothetical protein
MQNLPPNQNLFLRLVWPVILTILGILTFACLVLIAIRSIWFLP